MDEPVPPKPLPRRRKTAADPGVDSGAPAPQTPRRRAPPTKTLPPVAETPEPATASRAAPKRTRAAPVPTRTAAAPNVASPKPPARVSPPETPRVPVRREATAPVASALRPTSPPAS